MAPQISVVGVESCIVSCSVASPQFQIQTSLAGVVDQHDLHKQVSGRAVDDTVDGPQQRAPSLVVKHNDNAGVGKVVWVDFSLTADSDMGKKWNAAHYERTQS